jgi:hypothetical protein
MRSCGEFQYSSSYLAKVLAIPTVFTRFSEFMFKKFKNFEYEFFDTSKNTLFIRRHQVSNFELASCISRIRIFRFLNLTILLKKFQNSKNGMHNFSPNHKRVQNFSSLSLKVAEKSSHQIFVNGDGCNGGGGNAA